MKSIIENNEKIDDIFIMIKGSIQQAIHLLHFAIVTNYIMAKVRDIRYAF